MSAIRSTSDRQFGGLQTAGFILVLARISPLFVLAPIFSSRMIPRARARASPCALAIGMAPLAMQGQQVPNDVFALAGWCSRRS